MLYSDRKRFFYIHNPKTAGVSLRRVLAPSDDSGGVFWDHEYLPELERIVDKAHLSMAELEHYPEAARRLATHFVFGFVRNPYSRTYSAYRHHCKVHDRAPDDFEAFLDRLSPAQIRFDWRLVHFSPQHRFFYRGDKCQADFIGRYERLGRDYLYIARRLGLPSELTIENTTDGLPTGSLPYLEHYCAATLARVNFLYAEDFHLFGYEMLTSPALQLPALEESALSRQIHRTWVPAYELFAVWTHEAEDRLRRTEAELQEARDRLVRLEAAVTEAHRVHEALDEELVRTRRDTSQTVRNLEEQLGIVQQERLACQEAACRAEVLDRSLREAQCQLTDAVAARAASEELLAALRGSRSWRLTAPLRWLRARLP